MITIVTPYRLNPRDKVRMEDAVKDIDGVSGVTPRDLLALDVTLDVPVVYNEEIVEAIRSTLRVMGFKHSQVVQY